MDVEEAVVTITAGTSDISADVIFTQTNFQVAASAQPGSCQITVRGLHPEITEGDLLALYINGRRMWWGYLFIKEQGFVFPDKPEPRLILHGVDLNILFDKLFLYNRAHPVKYPDGGGTYKRMKVTLDDGKNTGYVVSVPIHTMDKTYIQTMMKDFDLNKVSPTIKYGQAPFAPSDCKMVPISEINTGDTQNTWTPPSAGTSLRAFFTDVSSNIIRSQPGSAIWYIDPDGYIVWREQDYERAPWSVGDNAGSIACKNLSVTTDISMLKNDVLVFTGTLDPTPTSTQEFLRFVHKVNNPSVNLFGRFQWSEVMGSDWMQGMVNARANKLLNQEGTPAMRASFTVYKHGLFPGQIVSIFSGVHTFTTYDPVFGLQTRDGVDLPIRAMSMSFPTPTTVEYQVTCSYDTQDPWGLLLALKRPPTRGLVQPNFNVISRQDPKVDYPYVVASPMTLVKEWPAQMSGGKWQCSYAYVRGSLTVVVKGLRQTALNSPDSTIKGFIEVDPDKGIFQTDPSAPGRPYIEYHVWHNLDANAV
jgi:hypothetical protein